MRPGTRDLHIGFLLHPAATGRASGVKGDADEYEALNSCRLLHHGFQRRYGIGGSLRYNRCRTAILKDAGSGPASQGSGQTTGVGSEVNQHPPTNSMNRASGDVAASSQDAQRQMQGQPTAAQQAEGARQGGQLTAQETQRQMHAQPSVAEQPKGTTGLGDDEGC